MSYTIRDGGLAAKDPSDIRVFQFDWGAEALEAGASVIISTFQAIGIRGDLTTTPLSLDAPSVLPGERQTQVRIDAGARGSIWRINNKIVTDESPSQTIERSFFLLIEER